MFKGIYIQLILKWNSMLRNYDWPGKDVSYVWCNRHVNDICISQWNINIIMTESVLIFAENWILKTLLIENNLKTS